MSVRIREAQPEDAPAMARVFVASYTHAHSGHVSQAEIASRSYAQSEAAWRRGMREIAAARAASAAGAAGEPGGPGQRGDTGTLFLVAETASGDVVGIAVTGPAQSDRLGSTVPEEWVHGTGEVYSLYVDVPHQRQGIGRALIEAIAEHHVRAGRDRLVIGVLTVNAPARRFYEAMGGQSVGTCLFPDEDGSMLDGTVYGWALRSRTGPTSPERRSAPS